MGIKENTQGATEPVPPRPREGVRQEDGRRTSHRLGVTACVILIFTSGAYGQDIFGAVLNGSLVKPQVGAWAWYDLSNTEDKTNFVMRLAIVGKEKVKGKDGYWLEVQVVPSLGYETVYKLLLTGPASDPANIHKMFVRDGVNKVEEVPVAGQDSKPEEKKKGKKSETGNAKQGAQPDKSLVGDEDVKTLEGNVGAQHFAMKEDDKPVDVWLNDSISPMGVVQLKSESGTLVLRNHGMGGRNADSILDKPSVRREDVGDDMKVNVRVEKSDKSEKKVPVKEAKP